MKIKSECAHCGKPEKHKVTVEIKEADRERLMQFVDAQMSAGRDGTIPPSKYPKIPLVIPSPGQDPCPMCKHGQDSIGPYGCGRAKSCFVYQYYQIHKLSNATGKQTARALEDFTCAAPNASWLVPTRKRTSARSVDLPFVTKPPTSSVPAASSQRSARRKSKWRKS